MLLDLSLPDAKGVETVVRMQREADALPIIVLTGLDDDIPRPWKRCAPALRIT